MVLRPSGGIYRAELVGKGTKRRDFATTQARVQVPALATLNLLHHFGQSHLSSGPLVFVWCWEVHGIRGRVAIVLPALLRKYSA